MTHSQHKTRLVTGGLGKTNGATDIANDAKIIDHFYLNSKAYLGLECGYNAISLKNWQCTAPDKGGFVLPSNSGAMRSHMRSCTRTALGVLASGNAPADQFGESTPTLNGGFQFSKTGGQHG